MQSYKLHIVSEHLKDRHPYLEPDFNDRYDPSEVKNKAKCHRKIIHFYHLITRAISKKKSLCLKG